MLKGEITVGLLKKKIETTPSCETKIFIIDGFPRNIENLII